MVTTTTGLATSFINFSRTSNATVTNNVGNIAWAGHNLLLASEQFDASTWLKTIFTISANASVAPNGTTTADIFNEGTANALRAVETAVTTAVGVNYSVGVFLKYIDARYINVTLFNNSSGTTYSAACFDIQNGVVAGSNSSGTGYAIVGTPSITPVGNNWYYCSFVATVGSAAANYVGISTNTTNTFSNYGYAVTFVGTNRRVEVWGAQFNRADLGGMVPNPAQPAGFGTYYPTTPRNLLGFTDFFDNAVWTKTAASIIANNGVAPDGLTTADLLIEDTTNSTHRVFQNVTTTTAPHAFSAYIKAGTRTWAYLRIRDASGTERHAWFNLATGTVGTVQTNLTATMTSAGNGWFRCTVVVNSAVAGTNPILIGIAESDAVFTYTGNGSGSILIWGAQLSDSASIDPYVANYTTAPTAQAYYGPRLDYDGSTLAAKGLLVEEQRTNLLTYSDAFDNGDWSKNGTATVTANTTVAPDGTTTADTASASGDPASGVTDTVARTPTVSSSTAYTASLYVRGLTGTTVKLLLRDGSTGVTSSATATLTSSWQRISCTLTSGASTTAFSFRIGGTNGTVAIWGAQLEAGSFATSYIPTAAATVTRNADVASVATSAFPYSSSASTLVVSASITSLSANRTLVNMGSSTDSSGLTVRGQLRTTDGVGAAQALIGNAGITGNTTTANAASVSGPFKAAYALATDDLVVVLNGGTAATDSTVTVPPYNVLRIGTTGEHEPINGHIRQITYIPRRLSNAELQQRTT